MFCSSEVTTIRFAAVRTLNQISIDHPYAVSACNQDLESLISDSNRSIATLAITTLLKTGAESSIDRWFFKETMEKILNLQSIKSYVKYESNFTD